MYLVLGNIYTVMITNFRALLFRTIKNSIGGDDPNYSNNQDPVMSIEQDDSTLEDKTLDTSVIRFNWTGILMTLTTTIHDKLSLTIPKKDLTLSVVHDGMFQN